MATVNQILDFFEEFAPVASAMEFDNVGLLAGSADAEVNKVLLSLDITPEVVEEAKNEGCKLIISHHPVIFQPLKRLEKQSAAYLLAKYDITAVCMHTNLDLSEVLGVNTCLADAIGVKNLKKAEIGECLFIGELEQETDIDDFALKVKSALSCEGLRYTAVKPVVKTVAVSSGSGGSNAAEAAALGADALVVGEIKHHDINNANTLGLDVIDAGHFKSEDIVILPLKNKLEKRFPDTFFTKSKVYGDKVKYI